MEQNNPPAYIIEQDKNMALKLGKFLMEKADWSKISTRELLELNQLLMWYNTLPKKLEDNVMEPKKLVQEEEMKPEPKKPTRRKTKNGG